MTTSPAPAGLFPATCRCNERYIYTKMPVMTPNTNTPNVMPVTPMKVYFMSKVGATTTLR